MINYGPSISVSVIQCKLLKTKKHDVYHVSFVLADTQTSRIDSLLFVQNNHKQTTITLTSISQRKQKLSLEFEEDEKQSKNTSITRDRECYLSKR